MNDLHTTEQPSKKKVELLDQSENLFEAPHGGTDFADAPAALTRDPNKIPNLRSAEHQIDSRIVVSANFETIGRYGNAKSGTSSAIAFSDGSTPAGPCKLDSGTSSTAYSGVWLNGGLGAAFKFFDKSPWFSEMVQFPAIASSNTKLLYVIAGSISADGSSLVTKHFGFIIKNDNGTGKLYITFSNGAANTTKQIQNITITLTDPIYLHAKLVSGRYAEFYVNGELVYTEIRLNLLPAGVHDDPNNRLWMADLISTAGTTNTIAHLGPATVGWKAG